MKHKTTTIPTLGTGPAVNHYRERVKRLAEVAGGIEKRPAPVVKRRVVGSREAEARRLREEQAQGRQ